MNKKENLTITHELENVSADINNITQCLQAIENSLFFASERTDKDMTKPCAAATEMVMKMLCDVQGKIEDIAMMAKKEV